MKDTTIRKIHGTEILDSRGNPTVCAEITLGDGTFAFGIAPSGASTGMFEAHELRDGDAGRYQGMGVTKAIENIEGPIFGTLCGKDACDIFSVDRAMISADGTENKSNLGANAMLAVSIAAANAAAKSADIPLYRFLGGINARILPLPMMNILNGGAHSKNPLDTQEFMIVPLTAPSFSDAVRQCAEIYHALKKLLADKSLSTAVGDEGGFAPELHDDREALEYLISAISSVGLTPGKDVSIALDAAASEWSVPDGNYHLPKSGVTYTPEQLIAHWSDLCSSYPIVSIEDPLGEEDWPGWTKLTELLGSSIRLVGDDLFVTNKKRLLKGIQEKSANAILIKPNQIGTVSETLETILTAQKLGYDTIISHRSGETCDTTVADLAVAVNAGLIKSGAPCRGERTSKYNRLISIEKSLGSCAVMGPAGIF